MSEYLLTICLLSIRTRHEFLRAMLDRLMPQLTGRIELIVLADDGDMSIGAKRQRALEAARGEFFVCIDDDDEINDGYGDSILDSIRRHARVNAFGVQTFRCVADGPV